MRRHGLALTVAGRSASTARRGDEGLRVGRLAGDGARQAGRLPTGRQDLAVKWLVPHGEAATASATA